MIRTRALGAVATVLATALFMPAASSADKSVAAAAAHPQFNAQALWQTEKVYCDTCHFGPKARAKLNLEGLDLSNLAANGETWEKVLRKLRNREMPPVGMPRPSEAMYKTLVSAIEGERDRIAEVQPNPGRPGLGLICPTRSRSASIEATNAW